MRLNVADACLLQSEPHFTQPGTFREMGLTSVKKREAESVHDVSFFLQNSEKSHNAQQQQSLH